LPNGAKRAFAFYDLFHRRGKHVFTSILGRFLSFWPISAVADSILDGVESKHLARCELS